MDQDLHSEHRALREIIDKQSKDLNDLESKLSRAKEKLIALDFLAPTIRDCLGCGSDEGHKNCLALLDALSVYTEEKGTEENVETIES